MRVELKFFSTLAKKITTEWVFLEPPDGTTVLDLMKKKGIHVDEVGILMVNAVSATFDLQLTDGDIVTIIPPIGGG